MGRGILNRQARPTYYQGGYRIRPWARPVIVTGVPAYREVGSKCVEYFRDTQGRVWRYEGRVNSAGNCVWYERYLQQSSFDGERMVWSDMTGNRYCK